MKRSDTPLKFTPYAWAKLTWMRDQGNEEIGGFGITRSDKELLFVEDIVIPEQEVTSGSCEFTGEGLATMLNHYVGEFGLSVDQCMRVWIHTHPSGMSANPSVVDETTVDTTFKEYPWLVMAILSRTGDEYARFISREPHMECLLDMQIDYGVGFPGTDLDAWKKEYEENVTVQSAIFATGLGIPAKYGYHNNWGNPIITEEEVKKNGVENERESAGSGTNGQGYDLVPIEQIPYREDTESVWTSEDIVMEVDGLLDDKQKAEDNGDHGLADELRDEIEEYHRRYYEDPLYNTYVPKDDPHNINYNQGE